MPPFMCAGAAANSTPIPDDNKRLKVARRRPHAPQPMQAQCALERPKQKRWASLTAGAKNHWHTTTVVCGACAKAASKAAHPALATLGWLLARMTRPALLTTSFLATSTACAFLPATATLPLAVAAIASTGSLAGRTWLRQPHALAALSPLQVIRGPVITLGCLRVALPTLLPGVWRAVQYWQRSLPIMATYLRTMFRSRALRRQGLDEEADQLWVRQHQAGADQLFDMLADIKGFYLKLAQILATKTDMLPAAYTSSLSRLMDRLPPAPWPHVLKEVERELHRPLGEVFDHVDEFPLASATVAQVHMGQLIGPCDPPQLVAIKVQHRGVKRMMRADLANMRLFVEMCDLAHVDLGFDLGSIVREYQVAVPYEFRFDMEADAMMAVRESLLRRSEHDMPALRHVIIPSVHRHLSTPRVLVMSLLEGVPLLHATALDGHIKKGLMHALIMAFGVQILLDGLFHTDPHGGNLMACTDGVGDVAVGLLDFGQMKRLTGPERLRYARLVLALASRDGPRLRAFCQELGIRIENCGEDFQEIAAYILFDTRMDIPEALQSPLGVDSHQGWRTARVPKLPRDLFMIMRVITLLRGILASMKVHDISSALLWQPLAEQAIRELEPGASPPTTHVQPSRPGTRAHLHSHPLLDIKTLMNPAPVSPGSSSSRTSLDLQQQQQAATARHQAASAAATAAAVAAAVAAAAATAAKVAAKQAAAAEAAAARAAEEVAVAGVGRVRAEGEEEEGGRAWRDDLSLSHFSVFVDDDASPSTSPQRRRRLVQEDNAPRQLPPLPPLPRPLLPQQHQQQPGSPQLPQQHQPELQPPLPLEEPVQPEQAQRRQQKHAVAGPTPQPLPPPPPLSPPKQPGKAGRQQQQQQQLEQSQQLVPAVREQEWLDRPLDASLLADGVVFE